MCPHCLDQMCDMGSICQLGIFAGKGDAFSPRSAGPHKDTKKDSKRGQFESEHMFPHAALKISGMNYGYQTEPTMSIPYGVHRGAQSGAGGGVSSTGSSSTASGWSGHLGTLAQTDFPAALRLAAIDQANAHWMNGNLTREVVFQIIQVVNGHAALGRLSAQQAGEINNEIADFYYRHAG
jgi:hypothetical protein